MASAPAARASRRDRRLGGRPELLGGDAERGREPEGVGAQLEGHLGRLAHGHRRRHQAAGRDLEAEERTHPLQHGATPEDIAESMVALCGPASRWAHGSIVDLDGGSVFAMTGRWMQESTNYFLTRDGLTDVTRGPSVSE